jgi:hypothetical protein
MGLDGRWLVCAAVACGPPGRSGLDATTLTASSSAGSSASGSTSGVSTTLSDQDAGEESPKFDTPPELPACDASDFTQIDLAISSPVGGVAPMHAWWGWDHCCGPHPWILLTEIAPAGVCWSIGDVRPVVKIETRTTLPVGAQWEGVHEADIILCASAHDCAEFDITFEILEPLISPDYPSDVAQAPLRASFDVAQDGWVLSGSLLATHCPGLDCVPCPCE